MGQRSPHETGTFNQETLLRFRLRVDIVSIPLVLQRLPQLNNRYSAHIDELLSFGPRLCSSLVHFQFKYENVSYNAKNEAKVTTDDLIRLAKACTNFRFVQLQGISASVSDYGVQAFFQNCPDLTHLEISGSSRGANVKLDGTCLAMLREHTDWVPKLKTLRLDDKDNRVGFMKAMRTLSKERIKLLIQLVSVSECKKWGDWELEVYHQDYRKGRKCSRF